jgi:CRP-like cAMP-binding protein
MGTEERQARLAGIDFFSGCTERQLHDIAALAEERALPVGAELCRQGEAESEVFLVLDGEADVSIDGGVIGSTHVGEIVGELAMLGTGRRAATVTVRRPMRVLVLDPREIDSVLSADPSSAARLSRHGEQGAAP